MGRRTYRPQFGATGVAYNDGLYATSPATLIPMLSDLVLSTERESFAVVGMNRAHRVVASEVLTTGCDGLCIVDPKQIFRWALTRARPVSAVILCHNHPSGDPTPSNEDRQVTFRVSEAGRVLGIRVLDHLIIGDVARWESMAARGEVRQ